MYSRPIRPVDRASSTTRKLVHLTPDHLYQYFGYRSIDTLLKHLPTISNDNVKLRRTKDDTLENLGQYATIHKKNSNKSKIPPSPHFGHTIYMDIGYGSSTAIEGVKYCLFLVDRMS